MMNDDKSYQERYAEFEALARERLSDERFYHTQCVAKLAAELAIFYGVDVEKARAAGVLHDITKEEKTSKENIRDFILLQTSNKSDIITSTVLENSKNLHHSITAFYYVKNQLGINDEDILNAILYHTTGRAGMSMLEKIIYVADAVSYDRTYEQADLLRKLSFEDIDKCIIEIIDFTVKRLISKRKLISADTIECYNDIILTF